MKTITGILEAHGGWIEHMGGVRYAYVRIRQDDGRVVNVPNIVAFTNVQSAIDRILNGGEQRVSLHCRGGIFILALEEEDGTVHSDYPTIRSLWLMSIIFGYGFLIISFFLFASGDKSMGVGGLVFLLVGLIAFLKFGFTPILFWPGWGARGIHKRSLA